MAYNIDSVLAEYRSFIYERRSRRQKQRMESDQEWVDLPGLRPENKGGKEMQKIVIVHHLKDVQHYLFSVPDGQNLSKGDLVLVRNSRGEVPAVCVCSSFSVPENVLSALQQRYGGKSLKPVIGIAKMTRFDDGKNAGRRAKRIDDRLTEDLCIGGKHCWQVKEAGNEPCKDVCHAMGDAGCNGCPIAKAIDKLAAYENTGVSPRELQQVVDLFSEFVEPFAPEELQNWMERCVWHVQKCNDQHQEIERLRKELEIANGTVVPAAE